MKYGDLIDQAIECVKTFNPVYSTVDSHADKFLESVRTKFVSELTLQIGERRLREGFYQASVLRLHTLRRIPQDF